MPLSKTMYDLILRRNYIFVGTVFFSAFAFEIGLDTTANKVWDRLNKGRQWKDIRHRYVTSDE